ncbi:MAG TPA: winged helix-turn-helix domain-containing protein [Rubrobacteraceae bacterium]|jgi:restriction system protein
MAIPDYQSVMLPLLRYAADEQEHSVREAIEALADQFRLTEEERKELLPSGGQATFDNRVGWARTYMKKAGLLESPRRSYFKITDRGLQALKTNPEAINNRFLQQYPEFREFKTRSNTKAVDTKPGAALGAAQDSEQTPREAMENAYDTIRAQLAGELLEQIMSSSPRFFETLVVDLLVNMGYGGTRRDAGEAVGGSGDEGIDGIIKEDRLGLEVVYIQAKWWKDTVQRPEPSAPAMPAQWAQQWKWPSASTPWPITFTPQYSHVGARACMAHSKLAKVCESSPDIVTWNALS